MKVVKSYPLTRAVMNQLSNFLKFAGFVFKWRRLLRYQHHKYYKLCCQRVHHQRFWKRFPILNSCWGRWTSKIVSMPDIILKGIFFCGSLSSDFKILLWSYLDFRASKENEIFTSEALESMKSTILHSLQNKFRISANILKNISEQYWWKFCGLQRKKKIYSLSIHIFSEIY